MLLVEGIGKKIRGNYVLRDVGFVQQSFCRLAIMGETGSGKTSLLKIIGGLMQPDEGFVMFEGKRVLGPDEQLIAGHPSIGFLSQHFELRNNYWVHEILEYANKMETADEEEIFDICEIRHLLDRRTDQLSGGEKQRVATARLLVNKPRLLLLDEPFSNLDMIHKKQMKQVLKNISERLGISSILVSHDPSDVLYWAEHLIILRGGRIVQQGSPAELSSLPADDYVSGLLDLGSPARHLQLISLVVRDYDEAIAFYTRKLGFRLKEDTRLTDVKRWVVVEPGAGGCALLLAKAADQEQLSRVGNQAGGRVFLFLQTDDLAADHRKLLENGVEIVRDPSSESYGKVLVFKDLYGNLWDLIEPANS